MAFWSSLMVLVVLNLEITSLCVHAACHREVQDRCWHRRLRAMNVRTQKNKKVMTVVCMVALALVSANFTVEGLACFESHYNFILSASQKFSAITLTARLELCHGFHIDRVDGASVHFYLCNKHGSNLKEIGHSVTGRDGTASIVWHATGNGDYWFVASCTLKDDGHSVTKSEGR